MASLFPLASFDVIDDSEADRVLEAWAHYLGPSNRPFGRQSFGLFVAGELVAAAVSASTVSSTCAGLSRYELVELARLVTRPSDPWFTRVALRLWREARAGLLAVKVLAGAGLRELLQRGAACGRHLPIRRVGKGRRDAGIRWRRDLLEPAEA